MHFLITIRRKLQGEEGATPRANKMLGKEAEWEEDKGA